MLKKVLSFVLVFAILVFTVSAAFAVIKGLEGKKHSIVKIGENVVVPEGAEVESVVSVGGSVTVYGKVNDVVSVGGSVYLKDTAVVAGDVVSVGGKVVKEAGAITKGEVVEVAVSGVAPAVSFFTKGGVLKGLALAGLLSFAGFLIISIVLVALFTPQLGGISSSMEHNFSRDFLVGLLIVVLSVPIVVVLAVSIVGIVLIPIWVVVFVCAALFGYIAAAHLLGKKTLQAFRICGRSMMTETLIGIVLLSLIGLVPIGGLIIKMIATLCGLGGVYRTRFGTN